MSKNKVVCIGEVLWDSLPKGMFLGGAPLNVAVNLNNLGIDSIIISAVGNGTMGERSIEAIEAKGLSSSFIQRVDKETGSVEVEVDEKGVPSYKIHENVAWDYIEATNDAKSVVSESDYVIIGSLAFRNENSAKSIKKLLEGYNGTCLVDVNFRKPFYSKELVDELLHLADIVKLNDEELEEFASWKGIDNDYQEVIKWISSNYNIDSVLLTRGEKGSTIYIDGEFTDKSRYLVRVKDTVGAGDAFMAGAIYGIIHGQDSYEIIRFANAMGAFVASRNGATPELDMNKINMQLKHGL